MSLIPEPPSQALTRLSRHRVLRLLGDEVSTPRGKLARDGLLSSLTYAAASSEPWEEDADERLIEAAVGASLVNVDEDADRDIFVALVSAQVLSRDSQFARLALLAPKLSLRSQKFSSERPFMALSGMALSDVLAGGRSRAVQRLSAALGVDGEVQGRVKPPRTAVQVADIVAASAIQSWLQTDDMTILDKAAEISLMASDALTTSTIELARALAKSTYLADMARVLTSTDPVFASPALSKYVRSRSGKTFFGPQITAIQEGCLEAKNTVVSLPTSAGKTLLAELRIVLALTKTPGKHAIYVAPYRLLSRQVETSLRQGLRRAGLVVRSLGAGFEWDSFTSLQEQGRTPDVLVMTPEKLDSLMRLASSGRTGSESADEYLREVALLVFDELQLVGRVDRGPRFELILTRFNSRYTDALVMGLCAARHGADLLAMWLGADEAITGGERPTGSVELLWRTSGELVQRTSAGVAKVKTIAMRGSAIDRAARLATTLPETSSPVLILETTRPNAESIAYKMQQFGKNRSEQWLTGMTSHARLDLTHAAEMVRSSLGDDHPLADLILDGYAFHHAGLPTEVLREIERLVSARRLLALGATTTVAEGADLPFQVVIIPHLTFPGETNRLERDLYYNVVGRAGRAGVAIEGTVIVLDSEARTLMRHVQANLWKGERHETIRGKLVRISEFPSSFSEYSVYQEIQSQILAWLAEGGAVVENQSFELCQKTFSWMSLPANFQSRMIQVVDSAFDDLEEDDFVVAASPYRLTELGRRSYLSGLGPATCKKIAADLEGASSEWLGSLYAVLDLDSRLAELIARSVLRSDEALEKTLWLRRKERTDEQRYRAYLRVCAGLDDWPDGEDLYEVDVSMLGQWIQGSTLADIGDLAPHFKRGLFSGAERSERASDASLYLSAITYPASWTWSGIRAMAGDVGERIPAWIRGAVEYGVPSEVAVRLISDVGVSRGAALQLANVLPDAWDQAMETVLSELGSVMSEVPLTHVDAATLSRVAGDSSE